MRKTCCLFLLLLAAGCDSQDPFQRKLTWAPLGDNDANLRVMIANPADLANGIDEPGSLSAEASPAVKRLLAGKRYPLPVVNASQVGAATQSTPDQPPAPVSGTAN